MGDHARREMIVRATRVARQNPAYRPIADNLTTSGGISSEVVCFTNNLVSRKNVETRRGTTGWLLLIYLMFGCGGSTRTSPPISPQPPIPSESGVTPRHAGAWTFNYALGSRRYQISRSAVIENLSDSGGGKREVSTNVTSELLSLSAADSGITFTAVVDTFSTVTQGRIGPVPAVQLPVQIAGFLSVHTLSITRDSSVGNKCNPISSTLVSDLHSLLTRFPAALSAGMTWRDSVESSGCQAGIPTTSQIISAYVVTGETDYEGRPALLVQRSDTIQAYGEGAQQQHSMKLDASGTGNEVYYLDTRDGRIARVTAGQELTLTITTSSRPHQFKQSTKQDFRMVP